MRHVVEYWPATHSVSACFFDPAVLPPDFDDRIQGEDQPEYVLSLVERGQIWWETPGEIEHRIHFYVDEDPPRWLLPHLDEFDSMPEFQVSSGVIRACALEDVVQSRKGTQRNGTDRYAGIGATIQVPPGRYQVTSWQAGWRPKVKDKVLREQFGIQQSRQRSGLMSFSVYWIVGLFVIAPALLIGTLRGKVTWAIWAIYAALWAVGIGIVSVAARWDRNPALKSAEKELPVIVVKLKTLP